VRVCVAASNSRDFTLKPAGDTKEATELTPSMAFTELYLSVASYHAGTLITITPTFLNTVAGKNDMVRVASVTPTSKESVSKRSAWWLLSVRIRAL
jgi:hypothetical protein